MAEVNIGGDSADRSYRYKRPRLQTKIEGRGNGIKTVIPNMVDVAKALHVDPAYATKFFGIELGAQSKYDPKSERSVVNGAHNTADLETLLNKFIEMFILCPSPHCRLPEITMKIRKDSIKADCAACGFNGLLVEKHRLITYILKDRKDKKSKKDKDGKKSSKEKREKREKTPRELAAAGSELPVQPVSEEVVTWQTDTSTEAQAERKRIEMASMGARDAAAVIDTEALEMSAQKMAESSPEEIMRVFMARDRNLYEVVSELRRLELSRNLDETKKIGVLLCSLLDFDKPRSIPEQLKQHASVLKNFAKSRHDQNLLIANIEHIAGVREPALVGRMPLILQALYEVDVLDEETILDWHAAPVESSWAVDAEIAAELREKSLPFIDWLKQSDDESDSEE